MKVAILVCGAYRTFNFCYPFIQKLFNQFEQKDFYLSTWDQTLRFNQPENSIPEKYYSDNIEVPLNVEADKLPILFKGIDIISYGNYQFSSSTEAFFLSLQKGLQMINGNDYDFIFKIRPDMFVCKDYEIPTRATTSQFFCHKNGWAGMKGNKTHISDWLFGFKPKYKTAFENMYNELDGVNNNLGVERLIRLKVDELKINDLHTFYESKYLVR